MRIIRHLVAADVQHWWLLLASWIVVVILSALAPCAMPWLAGDDVRLLSKLQIPAAMLTVIYPLLLLLLVAQVVQSDPLVGARAFWMTRPISARALLGAKALLLGTAGFVAPVLAELVRMTLHDVPPAVQLGAAIETGLGHALLLSLLMAAAAVTENLPRLLLLIAAALAALMSVLVAMVLMAGVPEQPDASGWSVLPDPTSGVVATVLLVAIACLAVATQYLTRSWKHTAMLAAVGVVAMWVLPDVWPWPFLRPVNEAPAWAHAATALQPRIGYKSELRTTPTAGADDREWVGLAAPMEIDGVKPRYLARAGIVGATIRVGESTVTSVRDLPPTEPLRSGDLQHPSYALQRAVLDVDRVPTSPRPDIVPRLTLFWTEGANLRKHAPGTGEYRGRMRIALNEHSVEAVLPLAAGAHHHGGAYGVTIHGASERYGVVRVQVHESLALTSFSRRAEPYYEFYLRHRGRREAVHGNPRSFGELSGLSRLLPISFGVGWRAGFNVRELVLYFSVSQGMNDNGIAIDETWLTDGELVVVRMTPAGSVERDVHLADLRLDVPSRSATSDAR